MKIRKKSENFFIVDDESVIPEGGMAFFDSGYGGLNVLKAAIDRGLDGNIIYYGDNARAPYGNQSPEKVKSYVREALDLFKILKVKAVSLACNTATALCDKNFLSSYPFFISGSYPPVEEAAKGGGEIYVFSTRATYQSPSLKKICARAREKYPAATILPIPLDTLAGEIEKCLPHLESLNLNQFFPLGHPKSVVLGCTHYSFLKDRIEKFYSCPVFDSASFSAETFLKGVFNLSKWPTSSAPFSDSSDLYDFSKDRIFNGNSYSLSNLLFPSDVAPIINKCSETVSENSSFLLEKQGFLSIYFVGSGKIAEKAVYEQMFAHK